MTVARQFHIADLFESLADAIPDRVALVSGDRTFTYAQLDERANRFAHFLAARGIGRGDHIGLYLYNGNEYLEAVLGAFKVRAVPINVNYRYVADELRALCADADLRALVFHDELAPRVAEAAANLPTLVQVADLPPGGKGEGMEAWDYETVLAASPATRGFPERSADDLYIIYTGGTTGRPRGVMWRHEDLFFAGMKGGNPAGSPVERPEQVAEEARDPGKGLSLLPTAPLIHGAAQLASFIAFFTGGKVVLAPGRSFQPERIWQLVAREQVGTMVLVGDAMALPLCEALERSPGAWDLSAMMVIASSGAILSRSVRDRIEAQLPHAMVLDTFGASETGHQGTAIPTDREAPRCCFYMDENNVVLDEELRPIAPGSGKVGRLARGGRVPLGYYKDPAKTAASFLEMDGRRWVLPGDMATVEADGRITVLGRGAVCINSGGEKVFPEEVEEALKSHPAVRDVLVVGVPDERWGERVAAVVEPQPGRIPTLEELDGHCRLRIAGYKAPRELHLVDQILRHPSGKPDYAWARRAALAVQATQE